MCCGLLSGGDDRQQVQVPAAFTALLPACPASRADATRSQSVRLLTVGD